MRLGRTPAADSYRGSKSPLGLLRWVLLLIFLWLAGQWAIQQLWTDGTGADPQPSLSHINFEATHEEAGLTLAPEEAPLTAPESAEASAASLVRLPSAWLETMQDGRLGLSSLEQLALDRTLQRVRFLDASELQNAATRDVGFATLNTHPEQFRGQLLDVEGSLWNLSLFRDGDPTHPGDEVYEAWLYTPDAGDHPTRVLFTDLPTTLKPGGRLNQPVRCVGYFLKRYGYPTARGTHVAPLFVARTLLPQSRVTPPAQVRTHKSWQRWLIELLVVGVTAAVMIGYLSRTRKPLDQDVDEK